MASSINTKNVDKLLEIFRQLLKSITSSPPEKNKELWEQCLEQSKREYIDELKEHESQLSPPRNFPRKAGKEEERNFEKAFQYNTTKNAEKKYRQMDEKYDQSIIQLEKKRAELIKEIDHSLYSSRDQLLEFGRAQGTLLTANWQKIRDILPVIDISQSNFQFDIQKSIDTLEAIKSKIEYQQQVEPIEKPVETEQRGTNKFQRIWFWIKRIPHWIYYLVSFLAALLAIIHYIGWI